MRDDQLRVVLALELVYAVGHDFERVNVQARIRFIQHGHASARAAPFAKISARFFSPPEKPSFTDRFNSDSSSSSNWIFSRMSLRKLHRAQLLLP